MAGARKSGGGGDRPLTAQQLENAALHYLGRFASSGANLRRILIRKVARAGAVEEGEALVDALIARYLASGLLDDRVYAVQTATSLARRGASRYGIAGKLRQKGVGPELIEEALGGLASAGTGELQAACALARRRRLGPYRAAALRAQWRQKDMASLARAGFGLDIARRVLDMPDVAALEALARGEEEA
jgi:regulatory protein